MATEQDIAREFDALIRRLPTETEIAYFSPYTNPKELRLAIASLPEFYLDPISRRGFEVAQYRRLNAPAAKIQVDGSIDQLQRLYAKTRAAWEKLGNTEPYWSVVTNELFFADRMAGREEQFYMSGSNQVEVFMNSLIRNGIDKVGLGLLLEIGCGVGRMTEHFVRHFPNVIAADISAPHLRIAKERLNDRARFVRIADPSDYGSLPQVDVVFSYLALQHSTPPIMARVVDECLGRLRLGGIFYIHIPTFIEGYSFSIDRYLMSDRSEMEMHCIPQSCIFEIARRHGISLLEVINDGSGGDYRFEICRFLGRKDQ